MDLLQLLLLELLICHLELTDLVDAVQVNLRVEVTRTLPTL